MARDANSSQELVAVVEAVAEHGSKAAAARALGIPRTTLNSRLDAVKRDGINPAAVHGRHVVADFHTGTIFVGSDAHYRPGPASTAHRAFIKLAKRLKPDIVIINGDVLDAATISRHPPLCWQDMPTVKEELEVCQERMGEIAKASGKALKLWPLGNHDARFETRLATVAPEFRDVHGTKLSDHFPDWEPCASVKINDNVVVKHRYSGGIHATYNNTLRSGVTIITGHLHSQTIREWTDYNGTRYGVDTGCMADIYDPQFGYLEDNPRNWRSGFCILSFRNGRLLRPELVTVVEDGIVEFRGELIEV